MSPFEDSLHAFEKELGLAAGFFQALLREDDWSFVIKLHAVIEAATSHLLAETLGRTDLLGVLSHLELGDQKTGKVAFGRALSCLSHDDRRFITTLSKIRNTLVHDIRNAAFSLPEYVARLDRNQIRQIAEATVVAEPTAGRRAPPTDAVQSFRGNPKQRLWHRAMLMVFDAYQNKTAAQASHWQNRMMREAMGVDDDEDND